MAILANIRLDWSGLPGTNTNLSRTFVKYGQISFITLGPGGGATEIEIILSLSCRPRWPRQVPSFSLLLAVSPKNFANVKEP
jgi:hypothetical protein